MKRTVTQAIEHRRSVRIFKNENIDSDKVKKCIINATLAPIAVIYKHGNSTTLLIKLF